MAEWLRLAGTPFVVRRALRYGLGVGALLIAINHGDSLVCAINRDVILRLVRESPDVALRVLTMLGRRVRQFRSRIEQLSYKSAVARVARALVDLGEEHGVRDSRGTVIAFG